MINASGNTLIIDIRDELSFEYGHIDGAVNIPAEKLDKSDLPKDKKLLICCKSGLISDTEAEKLRELGYDAENLEGGYYGWLREKLSKEVVEDISQDAERSIQKKFRKEIWNRFTQSVNEYELIKPNDRIAGCIFCGTILFLGGHYGKYYNVDFGSVHICCGNCKYQRQYQHNSLL